MFHFAYSLFVSLDIPNTPFRLATIAGTPYNCHRAREFLEEMLGEVWLLPHEY